jgi:hypothetical protein
MTASQPRMMRAALLSSLLVMAAALAAAAVDSGERWFEDLTQKAGLAHKHSNRIFKNPYAHIMAGYTALGAAVAVGDYDRDGYEDIYMTDSKEDGKNHLYHNNGDLTFTDVAEDAGVANGNDAQNASADALWFDYNNDGWLDLLLIRFGHNQLFKNLGNGKFKDVTKESGIDRYMNAITAIAFDYDHDGYVDLFIGSYFQPINIFNPDTPRFFPESFETANNGGGVTVFHNNHDGTFTDVSEKAGVKLSGWTRDIGHGDANNDGWDDIYVACDFGTDHFFLNNGNGTFKDITETAVGFDSKKGMNVDWGDFDNDGLLDIYVTNITDDYMREGNFLWHNNGNLTFSDVGRETGTFNTGWGWAAKWLDYDNDGWLDIYVVNGWVSGSQESYVPDIFAMVTKPGIDFADARNWPAMGNKSLSGYQKKRLFHNEHGQMFKDEAPRHGIDSVKDGRGIGVADFDNDGRLDMVVSNANSEPFFYHNTMPAGPAGPHWVELVLEGTRSNRLAVGAQVRFTVSGKTYLRFVNGGNGFASQSTFRVHLGLADQKNIEKVEVRWPSGTRQVFENVGADHIYRIVEGNPKTVPFIAKATKR